MRAVFSILSLVIVVAVVGLIARKQLTSLASPPQVAAPAGSAEPTAAARPATPKEQVQQFKQTLDAAAQQPRALPDEAK